MANVKLGTRGGELVRSYGPFVTDHARLAFFADELKETADDALGLSEAIDAAYTKAGDSYKADEQLPISHIRAARFGAKALGHIHYRKPRQGPLGPWSGMQPDTQQIMRAVSGKADYKPWYRDTSQFTDGYPSGPIQVADLESPYSEPVPFTWRTSIWHLVLPFLRTTNPLPLLEPIVKTINEGNLSIGPSPNQFAIPKKTLFFDGATMDWVTSSESPTGYFFFGQYDFLQNRSGFLDQIRWFNRPSDPRYDENLPMNQWVTANLETYETSDFSVF